MNIFQTYGSREELLSAWHIDETRVPHAQWALGFGSLLTAFGAIASIWAVPGIGGLALIPAGLLALITAVLRWRRGQLDESQSTPIPFLQWVTNQGKTEVDS